MKNNKPFLISVFITAFIDMLGIGIIIPVLPALFFTKNAVHFAGLTDNDSIRWTYCLLMASYPLMQFFGAPILGSLSDRFGRKKIIMFSLLGTALGYSLFSVALYYQSIALIFISRIIPGFFGGSLSVLFSAISDVSSPEDKPKNFALIGMAFGLGFILGPAIGGLLASNTYVLWFNLTTPFIFTTLLCLINFVLVYFRFNETLVKQLSSKISFSKGYQNIKTAFTTENLSTLFSITFLNTLGFSFYTQFFSVFMFRKFGLDIQHVGYVFAWVGFWLIITQGFLIRKINLKFSSNQIVSKTMIIIGLSIIGIIFPTTIYGILFCNFIIAISQGLNSPNLLSLVSKQADPSQQGEIMGINQSMQSLGQAIPPLLVGIFGEGMVKFPFVFGGGLIILAWVTFVGVYRKK